MRDEEPPRGRASRRDANTNADAGGYEPLFTHDDGQAARGYRQSSRGYAARDGRADSTGSDGPRGGYSGRNRASGSTPYGGARDESRSHAPRPRPTPGGRRPQQSPYGAAGRSGRDRQGDDDGAGGHAARDYPAREYGAREYPAREYGAREFPVREYGAREFPAREYRAGRDDHADAGGYAGGDRDRDRNRDGYADDPYARFAADSSWSGSDPDSDDRYGEYGENGEYPNDGADGDDGEPPDAIGRHRRSGGGGGGGGSRRWVRYTKRGLAVFGVLILLAGGYVFYEYKRLDGNIKRVDVLEKNDSNIRQAEKQRDAENFLLIGSDTREGANSGFGEVEGARSDTTILAHLSPGGKKAIMVSFPRDAWVDLPSCDKPDGTTAPEQKGQFNWAFSTGGANCTIRAVQKLTGIAVTHYVQIDFNGFSTMVHALGGVDICSNTRAFDKDSGLRLTAGNNHLDGAQALAYVRARYGLGDGSDLDRIERQQRFLGAMMRKATSGDILLNPIKLQRFLDAATKSVTLDDETGLGDIKDLAGALHGLDPAKVNFVTPPIANRSYDPNNPSNPKGPRVLLDDDGGRQLYDSIINDKPAPPTNAPTKGGTPSKSSPLPAPSGPKITVAPGDVRVYVYNGTTTNGLASQARDSLSSLGFDTVSEVSSVGTDTVKSEVHYGPGKIDMARTLAAAVPGSMLVEDSHYAKSVALILGSNYQNTKPVKIGDTYVAGAGGSPSSGGGSSTPGGGSTSSAPYTPKDAVNGADASCT